MRACSGKERTDRRANPSRPSGNKDRLICKIKPHFLLVCHDIRNKQGVVSGMSL
jgi:hypothetical protein